MKNRSRSRWVEWLITSFTSQTLIPIEATIDQCIDIYVQLFNLVFDSGFFPECWTVGIIKPLYKNKGDLTNPENYRPITLLRCMGKVFTAILNRRLCIISEEYNILNKHQCGFRSGHSTLAVRKLFVVVLLISARHLILFGELVFGKITW